MSERDDSIEAVTSADRERNVHGEIRAHAAWYDLDDRGRVEAYDATRRQRLMEAALDSRGLSATAKAVLARIHAR